MRRRAAALLLAAVALLSTSGAASAQITAADAIGWLQGSRIVTGGARLTLEPRITLEVSLEQPLYKSADGWRVGGVISIRATTDFTDAGADALAGVTATFPAGSGAAVQAQLLWREVFSTDAGRTGGAELVVTFATGF